MFAPKLYSVYKIPLRDIVAADYDLLLDNEHLGRYKIRQQDSAMLRQIRLITGDYGNFNKYIIFVRNDNVCNLSSLFPHNDLYRRSAEASFTKLSLYKSNNELVTLGVALF